MYRWEWCSGNYNGGNCDLITTSTMDTMEESVTGKYAKQREEMKCVIYFSHVYHIEV